MRHDTSEPLLSSRRLALLAVIGLAAGASLGAAAACGGHDPLGPPTELKQLVVAKVDADLSTPDPRAPFWEKVPTGFVQLFAQPMIAPRPESVTTERVYVQAVHDGTRVAFRLRWADKEKSEAGPLGKFSDALALEFPIQPGDPPPVTMGAKGKPVHLFHWRAQYQRDHEVGKPAMSAIYPNMSVDMYPHEFKETDAGSPAVAETFSPGVAVGNPQSYVKSGIDEIFAEGFSTSSVQQGHASAAKGEWANGEWTLVVVRPLAVEGGSQLAPGTPGNVAFAVWQGGLGEVGSRKCVTMQWTPIAWK